MPVSKPNAKKGQTWKRRPRGAKVLTIDGSEPLSYQVAVCVRTEPDSYYHNALRFDSKANAEAYGKTLKERWTEMTEFVLQGSVDKPNCSFPVPNDRYPVDRAPKEPSEGKHFLDTTPETTIKEETPEPPEDEEEVPEEVSKIEALLLRYGYQQEKEPSEYQIRGWHCLLFALPVTVVNGIWECCDDEKVQRGTGSKQGLRRLELAIQRTQKKPPRGEGNHVGPTE